jgi:hypothetical protein
MTKGILEILHISVRKILTKDEKWKEIKVRYTKVRKFKYWESVCERRISSLKFPQTKKSKNQKH